MNTRSSKAGFILRLATGGIRDTYPKNCSTVRQKLARRHPVKPTLASAPVHRRCLIIGQDQIADEAGTSITIDEIEVRRLIRPPSIREVCDDPIDIL